MIPELISLSEMRRENDIEFQFLVEDINEYKRSLNEEYISLNSERRTAEKKSDEEKEFQRENERREKKGLKLLDKGEVPEEIEEEDDDIFLTETAMIVTDMISLSGRLTEVR
jgi:carboxyl-terminal processing protease